MTDENKNHGSQVKRNAAIVNHLELGHVVAFVVLEREEEQDGDGSRDCEHGDQPEDEPPRHFPYESAANERTYAVGRGDHSTDDTCWRSGAEGRSDVEQ